MAEETHSIGAIVSKRVSELEAEIWKLRLQYRRMSEAVKRTVEAEDANAWTAVLEAGLRDTAEFRQNMDDEVCAEIERLKAKLKEGKRIWALDRTRRIEAFQNLDAANVQLAMLREAAAGIQERPTPFHQHLRTPGFDKLKAAYEATEADVEAWLVERDERIRTEARRGYMKVLPLRESQLLSLGDEVK